MWKCWPALINWTTLLQEVLAFIATNQNSDWSAEIDFADSDSAESFRIFGKGLFLEKHDTG